MSEGDQSLDGLKLLKFLNSLHHPISIARRSECYPHNRGAGCIQSVGGTAD